MSSEEQLKRKLGYQTQSIFEILKGINFIKSNLLWLTIRAKSIKIKALIVMPLL